ncbi:DHA1 family bicyclomycin/chloramphenicol resistance-like MFS transporter [Microbacterium terrae]|uniref:Bicyclomycin resistance protein n=1 Tax=Microbacterium terrae TaxID=69369 RepID=A0A0M2GVU8_9MICO|nr:multidrug effflux MFS transporter [Microbacterium terrae]KJL37667.1 Bicyclomycin resistance protein [Microbacterium terrae]MBP1076499.1 DHA1 family bicyclomycin/chloramphenicol resistance-like MFS transporter [Microbacterium terrae]GLJ97328.1 putative multidrug resistance transporter, Bcr/CflA family protein [Microbacterium terrae]
MLDTSPVPTRNSENHPTPAAGEAHRSTATGAIRTLGPNPATAPIVLHPGDSISGRRRVLYIVLLGALTALGPFTIDLYLPAFPTLEADFQTTAAAIQLTLTGTMLGFALGQLIVGPLSDKVGRRVPLVSVTALHVVASIAASLAPTLELLSIARVFQGAGAAAGGVVAAAIVRDLFGGRRLVVMLSRLALVSGVAPVLAPLVGSALLLVMPWRGVFVVLAVYGAVMLISAILFIPETLPPARRHDKGATTVWQRYRSVFSDRVFIGVLIIGGMTFSGLFSYLSSSPFLFQGTYGFDPQQYGILFAVNSLGVVIGVQTASRLAARFGPQWVLAFSTAVLVAAASALIITDQLGLGLWGTIVPLFVFMTACGFTFPCVQVLALDRHGKAAGTAQSIIGATNFGVAGIISPLVGWIARDAGITATTMATVMVGCALIGVLSLWLIVRPRTVERLAP